MSIVSASTFVLVVSGSRSAGPVFYIKSPSRGEPGVSETLSILEDLTQQQSRDFEFSSDTDDIAPCMAQVRTDYRHSQIRSYFAYSRLAIGD